MVTVQAFRYVAELDAFLVTEELTRICDHLGLTEWTPVVWMGRYFARDNDVGEHWFDNWDERESLEERARALGIDDFHLMVIVPERFADGFDGPCHPPELRKSFWTEVLRSLTLSHEFLFAEARFQNEENRVRAPETFLPDLEARIQSIREGKLNDV